jgi:hypothetical protein
MGRRTFSNSRRKMGSPGDNNVTLEKILESGGMFYATTK